MLKNKTYKTSAYKTFKIYEPKEREIFRLPYYPDRILHHAVMNVLRAHFLFLSLLTLTAALRKEAYTKRPVTSGKA
jgi:hypothetical protein